MKDVNYEYQRALHMIEMEYYDDANKLLEQIKDESLDAYIELAFSYDIGRGVPRDEDYAFKLYKAKLDTNHPRLLTNIASYCAENDLMTDSFERAEEFYLKAISIKHEKVYVALYAIGLLYINRQYKYHGNKSKVQLHKEGINYIVKSASLDFYPAMEWIEKNYEYNKEYINKKDYSKCKDKLSDIHWLRNHQSPNPIDVSTNYKMSCGYLRHIFFTDKFLYDRVFENLDYLDEMTYYALVGIQEELFKGKGRDNDFNESIILTNSLSFSKYESNSKKVIIIEFKDPKYECECKYVALVNDKEGKHYYTCEYYMSSDKYYLCEFNNNGHVPYTIRIESIDDLLKYCFKDEKYKSLNTKEENEYYTLRKNISTVQEIVALVGSGDKVKFVNITMGEKDSFIKALPGCDGKAGCIELGKRKYYMLTGDEGFMIFIKQEEYDYMPNYRSVTPSDIKALEYLASL